MREKESHAETKKSGIQQPSQRKKEKKRWVVRKSEGYDYQRCGSPINLVTLVCALCVGHRIEIYILPLGKWKSYSRTLNAANYNMREGVSDFWGDHGPPAHLPPPRRNGGLQIFGGCDGPPAPPTLVTWLAMSGVLHAFHTNVNTRRKSFKKLILC